jgi:hypothetical protein
MQKTARSIAPTAPRLHHGANGARCNATFCTAPHHLSLDGGAVVQKVQGSGAGNLQISAQCANQQINARKKGPHMQKEYVDFAAVPPSQWSMHDRLENWARWCRGSQRQVGGCGSPMFELYRSTEAKRKYGEETSVPVDNKDATRLAVGVAALPDKHRRALHWCYLHPRSPGGQAYELGVDKAGLAQLVRDGRQMLINRRV